MENYGQIKYELPFLNALCVEIPREKVQEIRTNQRIAAMAEDIAVTKLSAGSSKSGPQPLPRSFSCRNSYGAGIAIAVIDTGVMPHYDLTRPFNRIIGFGILLMEKQNLTMMTVMGRM